jgi:drug/metabolite transporter (DMT)-like permease
MHRHSTGLVFTVLAAALFGTLGIFGKSAVTLDVSVTTLLVGRFVIATMILWGFLCFNREHSLPRGRVVGLELGLGVVYGIMSSRTSRSSRGSRPTSPPCCCSRIRCK